MMKLTTDTLPIFINGSQIYICRIDRDVYAFT